MGGCFGDLNVVLVLHFGQLDACCDPPWCWGFCRRVWGWLCPGGAPPVWSALGIASGGSGAAVQPLTGIAA